jgi:hypothetical protein
MGAKRGARRGAKRGVGLAARLALNQLGNALVPALRPAVDDGSVALSAARDRAGAWSNAKFVVNITVSPTLPNHDMPRHNDATMILPVLPMPTPCVLLTTRDRQATTNAMR